MSRKEYRKPTLDKIIFDYSQVIASSDEVQTYADVIDDPFGALSAPLQMVAPSPVENSNGDGGWIDYDEVPVLDGEVDPNS